MNINELTKEIHQNAVDHGWYEESRSFGDVVALCHSELSEALEEYRNSKPMLYCSERGGVLCNGRNSEMTCEECYAIRAQSGKVPHKPEGVAVEMIDCIIRILDWCGQEGIDVEKILTLKHEYNKTRSYRHGGKVI